MRIARVLTRLNLGGPARQALASDPLLAARGRTTSGRGRHNQQRVNALHGVQIRQRLAVIEPGELGHHPVEQVEEAIALSNEGGQPLAPIDATLCPVLVEQAGRARARLLRRQVEQRQVVGALEVAALSGVALATLVVDESSGRIREGAALRITNARPPDGVDVDHPAVPEAYQGRIDLARQDGKLLVTGGIEIRAGVSPAGQEASVLQQTDTLIDESRVAHEIGEALRLRREASEHQSRTDG